LSILENVWLGAADTATCGKSAIGIGAAPLLELVLRLVVLPPAPPHAVARHNAAIAKVLFMNLVQILFQKTAMAPSTFHSIETCKALLGKHKYARDSKN
jgi:hypothetical protein